MCAFYLLNPLPTFSYVSYIIYEKDLRISRINNKIQRKTPHFRLILPYTTLRNNRLQGRAKTYSVLTLPNTPQK